MKCPEQENPRRREAEQLPEAGVGWGGKGEGRLLTGQAYQFTG